jgi:hypothetical protein
VSQQSLEAGQGWAWLWRGSLPCQHSSTFLLGSRGKCSFDSTDFAVTSMYAPIRGTSQYNVPGAIPECSTWSMIGAIEESRVAEIRIAMLLWVEDAPE